ncbi:uncharacterized protein LOC125904386 [Epinephelus fuscoguttatus]|uniref:uncharacterized protein LOC125904386 n=1 Tax=Epinephelus fuscoguttatus TaxID=293821 RepID=UPI0020D19EF9|nr:uncharacterized protein LOC125904386 [Epinephelus fuscoguttatus]
MINTGVNGEVTRLSNWFGALKGMLIPDTPASNSGELESRSLQQDHARTSQPIRQNISPFAERNYLSQAGYISPHPCTQTSGMKRKPDDDDGSEDQPSKKSKPGWYRGKNNCPATSSSTLYASTNIQARSAAVRNPPAQPLNQSVNGHSSAPQSSQAKSSIGSGVKRKADGDDDHHHTVSDRYIRSHDDSRRCRRDHTRTSSQSCNSPRVKRKRSHGDNYDSERSDHESKRVKKSSAAPSTCSSSSSSCTQTLHVRPIRRSITPEHHCQKA